MKIFGSWIIQKAIVDKRIRDMTTFDYRYIKNVSFKTLSFHHKLLFGSPPSNIVFLPIDLKGQIRSVSFSPT